VFGDVKSADEVVELLREVKPAAPRQARGAAVLG
jgi:hypothetical protein